MSAAPFVLYSTNFGAVTSEGLYRHFDQAGRTPPLARALRWLQPYRLSRLERRLVDVVLAETFAYRRAFAAISRRKFIEGVGLMPGPFSAKKVVPALANLQATGVLTAKPGGATGVNGRPAHVWQLGLLTAEAGVTKGGVLVTDSVTPFPTKEKRTEATSMENNISIDVVRPSSQPLTFLAPTVRQLGILWKQHQGWDLWPRTHDAKFDALLIRRWATEKAYPLSFWQWAIAKVPKGVPFRWLTTSPKPKPGQPRRVCRVEEWFLASQEVDIADSSRERADQFNAFRSIGLSFEGLRLRA